ncbi:MAG: NAD(P)-dependent oxidoreductase [Nitrospinota bacterium]
MEERIGFIGLGLMGKPMALRLKEAGYRLWVYDIRKEPVEEFSSLGATPCRSCREVAEKSEVIITMLPDAEAVEAAVLGDGGVAQGVREGKVLIDMTSNHPEVSARIADVLSKKSVGMLDAPVSGAPEGAREGTLSIMVGGEKSLFERCLPILQCMGRKVVHAGDRVGAGGYTKLANQILVGITLEGMAEALVFGAKAGVDPALLVEAMGAGLARCGCLEIKAPKIIRGDFAPGGKVTTHIKDFDYALSAARELGVPLPVTAAVRELFEAVRVAGGGEQDHASVIQVIERLAGFEARTKF